MHALKIGDDELLQIRGKSHCLILRSMYSNFSFKLLRDLAR
jgi:hypothetical protein